MIVFLIGGVRLVPDIVIADRKVITMTLNDVNVGEEVIIKDIQTGGDDDMKSFLFSLGCYSGEPITVVSRKKANCVVSIKDARYNIDSELAAAIII